MSNRSYSSAFNDGKAAPAFNYIYDSNWVTTGTNGVSTGAYRPYTTTDASNVSVNVSGLNVTVGSVAITGNPGIQLTNTIVPISGIVTQNNTTLIQAIASGNAFSAAVSGLLASGVTDAAWVTGQVSITNTAPIAVSGSFSATVGNLAITGFNSTIAPLAVSGAFSTTVGNVNITGNGTIDPISRGLLSGISGLLSSNLTDAAWVTGQVSLNNTAPIPISGVVQTSVSIGNIAITGFSNTIAPQAISGLVSINNTLTTQITGFNTGMIVSTQPVTKTAVSSSIPSGTFPFTAMNGITGIALNTNLNRVSFFIQNIHTGLPLYVVLNSTTAGAGNFNMILNPSINQGYGGDSFSDDRYRGQINVSGGAWIAWEL